MAKALMEQLDELAGHDIRLARTVVHPRPRPIIRKMQAVWSRWTRSERGCRPMPDAPPPEVHAPTTLQRSHGCSS